MPLLTHRPLEVLNGTRFGPPDARKRISILVVWKMYPDRDPPRSLGLVQADNFYGFHAHPKTKLAACIAALLVRMSNR